MSSLEPPLNATATNTSSFQLDKIEGGPDRYDCEWSHDTSESQGERPIRNMNSYVRALLVAGVLGATFLFAFDNTVVADIQPHIIQDLGEIQRLPWITVSFELGAASANLFWGKLYGQFDNKILFVSAILLFEVGSALCGAAPNMDVLIIGRLICGLGGNGIYLGLMGKLGYYMPWYLVGSALVIIGSCFMRNVGPETSKNLIYGYTIILGSGVGSYVQASFPVAQAKAKSEDSSNVLALMSLAQQIGLAIGFSVANAIFINRASNLIAKILPHTSRAEVQAMISGIGSYVFADLSSSTKQDVLNAVSLAIGDVYLQVLAGAAFSFVLALFLKREQLFL
ncbi:MAG: hypothetical protein Q9165_004974 [Trypethelium subeluteriae]